MSNDLSAISENEVLSDYIKNKLSSRMLHYSCPRRAQLLRPATAGSQLRAPLLGSASLMKRQQAANGVVDQPL